MKKPVYLRYILFLGAFIATAGCKKEHQNSTQGVIVGWNEGACATCGGFYVNMSADTVRDSGTYYVLNYSDNLTNIISQYSIQYNKNPSPIYISFSWQRSSVTDPYAPANWIRITAIQSR